MNKKYWLFSVTLFVLLIVMTAGQSFGESKEPYKVGAIFDITGAASWLGEPERNTAKMIEEEINKAGGINGHPLELIITDNESDETKSLLATKKLISKDNVLAIIGPSQSGTTMAIVPEMEKSETVLISCAASYKIVNPVNERKWIFKTPQSDSHAVEKIFDYLVAKKINKIALMTASTGFGDSGRSELVKYAPQFKMEIVADERFGPKDNDLSAQLTKIRGTAAQVVISWTIGPTQVLVAKNMRQLGMTTPLIQSHGFGNAKNIEMAGEAAEGILLPAGKLLVADILAESDPQKVLLLKYKKLYQGKFNQEVSTFGGHAWDALYLVIEALKEVGPNKAKIRDYLENKKNFVGTGGVFKFSPEDHNGLNKDAFVMLKVVKGKWALAD